MNVSLIYTETDKWAFGPRSISASLKDAGHKTRLILMGTEDLGYSHEALGNLSKLLEDSDLIGISSMARGSDRAKQVAEYIRPLEKLIVWGGVHPTQNPEECSRHADLVCVGEGEEFMVELADKVQRGNKWHTMAGAAYRDAKGRFVTNGPRPLVADLNQLPLFDFEFDEEFRLIDDRLALANQESYVPGEPIHFSGARGCNFHCTYCSNAKLKKLFAGLGPYVRRVNVSKYIEHARNLRQRFPKARSFYLLDEDLFARPLEEIREFSERFPAEVGLPFECMASPPQVSQEKMDLFVKAGLWRIGVGVESGSERTKKEVFDRPIPNKIVIRAANIINQYPQVVPYYFIIMGNPYEGGGDLTETIQLIKDLPYPFFLRTYSLVFFPNTLLYEKAVGDGMISGKEDSGYEMDFLAGLELKGPLWKKQNLYLNGLIYLMAGKASRHRLGMVPRVLIGFLTKNAVSRWNERFPILVESLILLKTLSMRLRSAFAFVVKRIMNDPTVIYKSPKLQLQSLLVKRSNNGESN